VWFLQRLVVLGALAFLATPAPAHAFAGASWSPPVPGRVARGFEPPANRFAPGHLGVDFAVPPGTQVRAAGDGVVVFAGRVGQGLHVVIAHAGGIRTSSSFLAKVEVVVGEAVRRGEIIGTSGGTGPGHAAGVTHFGVRVGDEYIDPMRLFTPPDLAAVVHLASPHFGDAARAREATDERSALVAALRVDARPPSKPPVWWGTAPRMRTSPPAVVRAAPVSRVGPSAPSVAAPTTGATRHALTPVVAGAVVLGALRTARRARRRGR
jgi:murein DD-endopeptidase MepM/ murein hydrolase activator NlpD